MLTCLPQGICSWTFTVPEMPGAKVAFFLIGEQGMIELDGVTYPIGKSGIVSPMWTLSRDGHVLARATVTGLLRDGYIIEGLDRIRHLVAVGILQGEYSLTQDGKRVAAIARAHPFTRRVTIRSNSDVVVIDQLFAFWLVTLRWYRSAIAMSGLKTTSLAR